MEETEIDANDIISLVQQARKANATLSRNDLAWQLGVADELDFVQGIYKAYKRTKDNSLMEIRTNDGGSSLIDSATPMMQSLDGDYGELGNAASVTSRKMQESLNTASESASQVDKILTGCAEGTANIFDYLKGQGRAKDINNEASQLQDRLRRLVTDYGTLVELIRTLSGDFVMLRNQVEVTYRKFAAILVDVYGERVKQIQPELFDFDSIQFLDAEQMLQGILEGLDNIIGQSETTAKTIGSSFRSTADSVINRFSRSKDTTKSVILGALDAFDHYSTAASMTNELERSYSALRESVAKSVGDIETDILRIGQMGATLNSVFIPHALLLCRYANDLMDEELRKLIDAMYGQPEASKLNERRNELLSDYLALHLSIADHLANARICKGNAEQLVPQIDELRAKFDADNARWTEGDRDFNEGYAKRLKERIDKIYRVEAQCGISFNAGADHEKMAGKDMAKLDETRRMLAENSSQMAGQLTLSDANYATLARHLADILRLLMQAKSILQSGFGDDLLAPSFLQPAVTLPELSAKMQDRISNFISEQTAELKVETASQVIEGPDGRQTPRELTQKELDEAEIDSRTNQSLDNAAELIRSSVILSYQLAKEQLAVEDYKRQMALNRQKFASAMAKVGNRAALIRTAAHKAGTAADSKAIKDALLLLTDIDPETVSDEKMVSFVKGNGTITI